MNILFRSTKTQKYKDSDRKYLSFEPILFEASTKPNELNYISATANDSSIDSPLLKIINHYDYDFTKFSDACWELYKSEYGIHTFYSAIASKRQLPPIILIKQTYGNLSSVGYLMESLIARVNTDYTPSTNIHFTHYSLIFNKLPHEELKIIFEVLLSKHNTTNISNFYIDIDNEFFEEAINLYKSISGSDCVGIIN
jgi:hypothetical protein